MEYILKKLVHDPSNFNAKDAGQAINDIIAKKATPSQTATFLVALRFQGMDRDPTVVAACAQAIRNHAQFLSFHQFNYLKDHIVDIVGTGGDGHDTFNVSTTASIVAAGAGAKVAKHGSRSVSSKSGSADLLEAYGCHVSRIEPSRVVNILDEASFCFLFSQNFYPSMRHISELRKEMSIPTVFNLLGPMSNPACPSRCVVGVHSPQMGRLMANTLQLTGVREGLVVCGAEHLDEISPSGETYFWRFHNDHELETGVLHPTRDFGLPTHALTEVTGGDSVENAALLRQLLNNELPDNHPILDFVLLNTSALLVVAGIASDYKDGVARARASIKSGEAKRTLDIFCRLTQ